MRTYATHLTTLTDVNPTNFAKKKLMLLVLLSLGALLLCSQLYAAEQNLYAKNYQAQNTSQLKSLSAQPDTKMYLSNHKGEDNISMLEDGYDMMGSTGFSGTFASVDGALQFGKTIKADKVLVYRKYGSAKTGSAKFEVIKQAAKTGGEIDEKDLVEDPTEYNYYASYWAKLPMPLLGVHVIKLVKAASDDGEVSVEVRGLKIIAVIKDSPAAKANIVKGDTLLKIGDVSLVKADDLFAAVKRYAGQIVPIKLQHDGAEVNVNLALNSRS
ncbi:MAG: PDZ domain-containing protein [Methylotenera sp.]|nr:PDZ domain-containing protein [Methylotenera sp.]MSP99668.1 PDZ domain-containing protein [Methylotenera sp.]